MSRTLGRTPPHLEMAGSGVDLRSILDFDSQTRAWRHAPGFREGNVWNRAQQVALALLASAVVIVASSAVQDLRERRVAPEVMVRDYFSSLEAGDANSALSDLDPATRDEWSPFVENSVLNHYNVSGIAVHQPSIISRLLGGPADPDSVTLFLTITEWTDGTQW